MSMVWGRGWGEGGKPGPPGGGLDAVSRPVAGRFPPLSNSLPHEARGREDKKAAVETCVETNVAEGREI